MTLSVLVPSYKDPLLRKTVESILENSGPNTEVIPILDGYLTNDLPTDPRVKVISLEENKGMRGAINAGLFNATGDFIMKSDSHCHFAPNFDKVLMESCQENWLMIPRRYSLDEVRFDRNLDRPVTDYHYFGFPKENVYGFDLCVVPCHHHTKSRASILIDDTMAFQGSCWFANRKYFMDHVGFLDDSPATYGTFAGDQAEIGLKYWLNGGEIKVNKNTWYAHLQKTKRHYAEGIYTRGYKMNRSIARQRTYATKHWMNNEEPGMQHTFSWLIEKFSPLPGWESYHA